MRYLSFDLEATGLRENDLIIEFGMVPFDTETGTIEMDLKEHFFVQCPSFEELKPNLDKWVIDHNEELITKAHETGLNQVDFKKRMVSYLESDKVKEYFGNKKITLFGKSVSAIDLPFMNRDLGWEFMRTYFEHRQLDLSSVAYNLIDMGKIPKECQSGSALMNFLEMGDVAHTALEDAVNTAKMYLKLIDIVKDN
ncbi:MAG: hypothetical protein GY909_12870 [Oligoflexia bacterium]|nr:hypothetical protein [Oligoflexia bacterium]